MSLFLRNLLFTLLQPGLVAGVVPYLILEQEGRWVWPDVNIVSNSGMILGLAGVVIMGICIIDFGRRGKGTLSPADPTRQLVVSGLYRFSRNPMYVGVLMILAGEALVFHSLWMAIYTLLIFVLFHGFIVWFEEPRLSRDFGVEYEEYSGKVRRWM